MSRPRGTVIDGEFIDHGRAAPAPPRKPRRRWPWIVGGLAAVVTLCLAVPLAILAAPLIRETIEAGEGASTPMVAFIQFAESYNHGGRDGEMLAARAVTGPKRDAILAARKTFLADRDADVARHPEWVWDILRTSSAPPDAEPESVSVTGDRATIVAYMSAGGRPANRDPMWSGTSSMPLAWHAEAVRQHDGWRLASATTPKWCGELLPDGTATGYSKC